jgi:hemerythrin superfamily protein
MLLSEHKTINSKYFKLENIAKTSENPSKILSDLLKALSSHARKEEKLLPPLLRSLNEEQLKKIDEKTASLGYNV